MDTDKLDVENPFDVVGNLQRVLTRGDDNAFNLAPKILRRVLDERLWADKVDQHGVRFASFDAFVTAPLWHGLGSSIDDLLTFTRKHPDVLTLIRAEIAAAAPHGGTRTKQADNVSSKRSYGNNPAHGLARLKRDRPDVADRVVRGELSVHAAMVEAGIRSRMVQVPVDRPDAAARTILTNLSPEDARRVAEAILSGLLAPS